MWWERWLLFVLGGITTTPHKCHRHRLKITSVDITLIFALAIYQSLYLVPSLVIQVRKGKKNGECLLLNNFLSWIWLDCRKGIEPTTIDLVVVTEMLPIYHYSISKVKCIISHASISFSIHQYKGPPGFIKNVALPMSRIYKRELLWFFNYLRRCAGELSVLVLHHMHVSMLFPYAFWVLASFSICETNVRNSGVKFCHAWTCLI